MPWSKVETSSIQAAIEELKLNEKSSFSISSDDIESVAATAKIVLGTRSQAAMTRPE